jgi:hypothetical protein
MIPVMASTKSERLKDRLCRRGLESKDAGQGRMRGFGKTFGGNKKARQNEHRELPNTRSHRY